MLVLEGLKVVSGSFTLMADIVIPSGGFVAVVGPSGAGKSTLLSAIAGFQPVASGRILWGKADITDLDPGDRPVAVVFQDGNLFPHLSVWQNVALGVSPRLSLSDTEKARVAGVLASVGLSGMDARKPSELSGGQRSRTALARVLVQDRPIVLLDEPFSALGPALRTEMLELAKEVLGRAGATTLMVTHDPRDAHRVADLTVVVNEGMVSKPQPTAQLFSNPTEALRDYTGE